MHNTHANPSTNPSTPHAAGKRIAALRGATQCVNTPEDIRRQVAALYDALLERNRLAEPEIISIVFSVTPDLDALNPASALRQCGKAAEQALFAVQEAAVRGGLARTIRVLIHAYLDEDTPPCFVYRNGAEVLRPDKAAPIMAAPTMAAPVTAAPDVTTAS